MQLTDGNKMWKRCTHPVTCDERMRAVLLLVLVGQRVHEVVVVPIIQVTLVGRADGEVSVGNTGNIPTSSSSRCLSS